MFFAAVIARHGVPLLGKAFSAETIESAVQKGVQLASTLVKYNKRELEVVHNTLEMFHECNIQGEGGRYTIAIGSFEEE